MNSFLFIQIISTVLGILIIGEIISLFNKKMALAGIISIIVGIVVMLIGIITPISIVICTIIMLVLVSTGWFAIYNDKKKRAARR